MSRGGGIETDRSAARVPRGRAFPGPGARTAPLAARSRGPAQSESEAAESAAHAPRPPSPSGAALIPARSGAGPRALEPADTLTRYMAELAHYPPISREEEHALALRWRERGDTSAARRLVLANLRLVVKIAMEYRRAWTNALDLIQEGNVGLLQATHRFDPYQGVKLSSYAAYWIRAYILKYILDNFRVVRLGTTRAQRKLFFRLNKEKRQLEREGFQVEPALLAERLDVSEADVVDMEQRLSQSDLSLNAPVRPDDDKTELGDTLSLPTRSAEEDVGSNELREVFDKQLAGFRRELEARDLQILERRVLAENPRTLQELADEFGVSRERVRQLEARLVARLREYMKQNLVDFEYYASPRA